jgi:hypothetical protein
MEENFMSRFNFFDVINVDGYDFPATPQVRFGFLSQSISFLNRSDYVIEYSFDGTNIHGDLNPNDSSSGLVFDGRVESKVWFRALDGYGTCRVEAWGMWGSTR